MIIELVPYGSERYESMKQFREEILRKPLGLRLSHKDLEGEVQQIHIAALDANAQIIGTVILKPLSRDLVKLRQMAVSFAFQCQGIGKQLVQFAENTAQSNGFEAIEMNARVSAKGFYEKLGYQTEGREFIEVSVATIKMRKVVNCRRPL